MKNKINRILSLLMAIVMLCAVAPVSAAAAETETRKFSDVSPDAWYAEAVNAMAETGLLLGDGNGKFNPDAPITFGEFATLLCRIYGLSTDEHEPHEQNGVMCNSSHWASGALWMTTVWPRHFIIFPRACADADEPVNRGEAIDALDTLTYSMPKYWEIPYDDYDEYGDPIGPRHITEKVWTLDDIPDGDIIREQNGTTGFHNAHGWNWTSIVDAYNVGIVSGDETGACNPLGNITRAEVCQIMYNMGLTAPGCVTYYLP